MLKAPRSGWESNKGEGSRTKDIATRKALRSGRESNNGQSDAQSSQGVGAVEQRIEQRTKLPGLGWSQTREKGSRTRDIATHKALRSGRELSNGQSDALSSQGVGAVEQRKHKRKNLPCLGGNRTTNNAPKKLPDLPRPGSFARLFVWFWGVRPAQSSMSEVRMTHKEAIRSCGQVQWTTDGKA
ncbi:unnamed protein product [Pseudo-nitzschia multistriata]|uniref:Uncharacterized protein n=1 Tax=Pseudo-nitzschia multistriata TaxID=183589 RepID=A0A448ZHA5_9STRA|nr:unnamed protein product [Pseudo-nitzschia multistriata]